MPTQDNYPTLSELPESIRQLLQGHSVHGFWAPIQVEPIHGSDERITTSIAAWTKDNDALVERCIRPEVLRLLYGSKARMFNEMIASVEHSVGQALRAGTEKPLMPLQGFLLGLPRRAEGRNLDDLIIQGRMLCASLSKSQGAEVAASADEDQQSSQRWETRIRAVVLTAAQDLEPFFRRKALAPSGMKAPLLGFYNGHYAAQFGVIRGDNPGASIYHLKPRLWELVNLKPDLAGRVRERDLIVHRPNLSVVTLPLARRDRVRDVIDELIQNADRQRIYVFHTNRTQDAANRLTSQARRLA